MQVKRAYKPRRASAARFPLPTTQWRVLQVLDRDIDGLSSGDLARLAEVDLPTFYVALGRLRRAGLVTTRYVEGIGGSGRRNKFADSRLTASGHHVASCFSRFLRELGAPLCKALGWR